MTNEELAVKIQSGEKEHLETLWEQNRGLITIMSTRLYNSYQERCLSCGVELDDIIQCGYFALCEAIQAFKLDTGYKLMSYFKYPLLNQFHALVGLRRRKRDPLDDSGSLNTLVGENETTERIDLLVDPASGEAFDNAESDIFNSQLRDALDEAIAVLSTRRAAAIRERYFGGKSQTEIAAEWGISNTRVSAIEREAFRTLRQMKSLQSFHKEILSNFAYKGTGLTSFRRCGSSPELTVERAERITVDKIERIIRKIDTLPEGCLKSVFQKMYFDFMTFEEVAVDLKLSVKRVMVLHEQGLRKISI